MTCQSAMGTRERPGGRPADRMERLMAYVVCATWKAKPGEEAAVTDLLAQIVHASEQEPGCLLFWAHRSVEDPATFFLYEQYASETDFKLHAASDHVRRLVLEDAVHRLAERRREIFELVAPDQSQMPQRVSHV
ncbi:MAG: putative quinol monooxygenase [Chloroflexota bacterium]